MSEPRGTDWLQRAATLSGVTALGLALLYATGLIARAGELAAAGFSPQDVLPLLPLQQGLARGVALLTDPTLISGLLLFTGCLLLVLLGPPRLVAIVNPSGLVPGQEEFLALLRRVANELEPDLQVDVVDRINGRLTRVQRLWREPSIRNVRHAREELLRIAQDLADVAHSAGREGAAIEALERRLSDLEPGGVAVSKRGERIMWLPALLMPVAAMFVVNVSISPVFAVFALFIGYSVYRVSRDQAIGRSHLHTAAIVGFLAFVLAHAYLDAQPLQRVDVFFRRGGSLKGKLLASPGTGEGTWYVATGEGAMRAIQSGDISEIRVYRASDDHGRFAGKSLLDLIRGR